MNYDPGMPRVAQTDDWSCSVAATTWLLRSLGLSVGYPSPMENEMLGEGLVGRADGLLDGSGGALASWLSSRFGLPAHNERTVDWRQVTQDYAPPFLLGGHFWYHWVGIRAVGDGYLDLANPADGWMGVHQTLYESDFQRLGPFSCVWLDKGDDVDREDLINKLGYLQGDVANALQNALESAVVAKNKTERQDAFDSIQAAINTLRRGGA